MTIREAHPSDSGDIARLTCELGYAGDSNAIRGRLERIASQRDQAVFVAILEQRIVGWLQAHGSESLESGYRVEIVGLIVGEGCRRRGIGRALVQRAERWALGIGSHVVVVRSNTMRAESHDFYAALGFNATKTQAVYRKQLTKEPPRGGVLGAMLTLLAMVLFTACQAPSHSGTAAATGSPSLAGQYVFSTADLRIDLYLRTDRTYYAAMDAWAKTTSERGVWHNQGEDIILKSEEGELQMSVRRLSPVHEHGETFYRIVDPDTEIRRAIVFRREEPSGPL